MYLQAITHALTCHHNTLTGHQLMHLQAITMHLHATTIHLQAIS